MAEPSLMPVLAATEKIFSLFSLILPSIHSFALYIFSLEIYVSFVPSLRYTSLSTPPADIFGHTIPPKNTTTLNNTEITF